ncbi:MAG: zeta toxin family protein [Candidatus Paceibacterota bacterium]
MKRHSKELVRRFASLDEYQTDVKLITIFMAGSPGAGKTEVARRLAEKFIKKPILIDADEIRKLCPGYNGTNAHIFQRAANKGVNTLYDYVLHKSLNAIVDGTFAYADSTKNITRSLERNRKVEIYFVYQEPFQAWEFTKKRETLEGRRVSKETFIRGFFMAQENVNKAKADFGNKIELNLVIKNNDNAIESLELNIDKIDYFLATKYTKEQLIEILV